MSLTLFLPLQLWNVRRTREPATPWPLGPSPEPVSLPPFTAGRRYPPLASLTAGVHVDESLSFTAEPVRLIIPPGVDAGAIGLQIDPPTHVFVLVNDRDAFMAAVASVAG